MPLQRRLDRKLAAAEYSAFLERKREMIADIDAHPVAIASAAEPRPVPRVEVPAGDLAGPWERQAKRRDAERQFERQYVARSVPARTAASVRRLLDWSELRARQQTRFFDGDAPRPRGRKIPTFV
jgi:hypothetical protein